MKLPLLHPLLVVVALGLINLAAAAEPDLVLRDTITDAAYRSYRVIPFDIPADVKAIEVRFDYTGREAKTTIDVGLLGPGEQFDASFRGWSGGNKRSFVLSGGDATPSYLSGPVQPGRWQLLLGVPNIRAGQTSQFTAEVYFQRAGTFGTPTKAPAVRSEAGWYRGDLHMHSGHSDGSCNSRSGAKRVPCPLFLTLSSAADRGLDFIAVTEHNTNSHVRELSALQPYFDRTLLIPGMELTTFQGHANAFNVREPIDFRVGSERVPDWNALLKQAAARGAIVSINHPRVPTGEACMGCGWSPTPAVDLSLAAAIEVVNGQDVENAIAGMPFWHEQLQRGRRLTAIGGSDTHDAATGRVGVPTTVIYATELSADAIVAGIRSGNVYIDTAGSRDRILDFKAREMPGAPDMGPNSGASSAANVTTAPAVIIPMGGELRLPRGRSATFDVRVTQVAGGTIEVIQDDEVVRRAAIHGVEQSLVFEHKSDGKRHWIRANVRDSDGKIALIGNPIYLSPSVSP